MLFSQLNDNINHIYLAHHDAFHVARHDRAFEPPCLRQKPRHLSAVPQRRCRYSTFPYQPPAIREGSGISTEPRRIAMCSRCGWRLGPCQALPCDWCRPIRSLQRSHYLLARHYGMIDITCSLCKRYNASHGSCIILVTLPYAQEVLRTCRNSVCAHVLDSVSLSSQPCCLIFHELGCHHLSSQFYNQPLQ